MSRYNNLFKEIQKRKPMTIMEIGVYDGQHAYEMIKFAQRFVGSVRYFGFDLFEDITPEIIKEENSKSKIFKQRDIENKLDKTGQFYKLYKGFTKDTLPKFIKYAKEHKLNIDFIFIDGGHSIETIKNDWFYVQKLMHKETVVLFDDYYFDNNTLGCAALIDTLINNPDSAYEVEPLQPIDSFQKDGWVQHTQMVKVTLL